MTGPEESMTVEWDRDPVTLTAVGGRVVAILPGVSVTVTYAPSDHPAALRALDEAVAAVRRQIERQHLGRVVVAGADAQDT